MAARAQVPHFSPLPSSVWLGSLPARLQGGWSSARGGQNFPVTLFFLREENLSRSPPASFLSHRSELGHMVTLTPSSWQEWNLHDSWRMRPQLTFPKAQGAAENSRFLNKIEVLLEQRKGAETTRSMCYSHEGNSSLL